MATTVEQQAGAEIADDKHIILTQKQVMVRQLPLPTTWTHARIGMLMSISPDAIEPPGFPASIANLEIWMGFCKSGANHPGLNPWTGADTHLGMKFGVTAGPSGVGETFSKATYANGDDFYSGATGMWLWKVFNGVATGLASTTNKFGFKAWKNYSTAKVPVIMEIADRGANWQVQCIYIGIGSGGFDNGMHYGQFVKAVKSFQIDNTSLLTDVTDQAWQGRAHMNVTTAQDNTRGRMDSMYILFRDHNATGTRLVIHGYAAACTAS
jgi:hypothetical protein